MRHFSPWRSTFFKAVSATLLALSISLPALAVPGRITGATPGSRVNIRTQPSTSASSPGYGLVGDRVEVIRSTTRDGFPWHYVRFPQSGVEGWINGNFIQVLEEPNPQPSRWSHTYTCGPYTVTLAETGRDQYSYRSSSTRGNLELANGRRVYSGSSWNYEFTNSNTVYVLEDAWNSPRFPNGFAELRVSQNGQPILRQTCRK